MYPSLSLIPFLLPLAVFLPSAAAHMAMVQPPALRHKANPYTPQELIDYDYVSPLLASGANFPCKGYHADIGTPAGRPVANYMPGGTYQFQLEGSATHNGGSCQLSLSYDKGHTWTVIKSWVGNCVRPDPQGDQIFTFTLPGGTPSADEVLLGWSWFNQQGNREMYHNCAVVSIGGGGGGGGFGGALSKRAMGPPMFAANVNNGCSTEEGTDVLFPQPGDQVELGFDQSRFKSPVGETCGEGSAGIYGGGVCDQYFALGYVCGGSGAASLRDGLKWIPMIGALSTLYVIVMGYFF